MAIDFSQHFTYKRLLRFTLPSIIMVVFTSIYGVVDGFFVSNFAGETAFAAVNFIIPVLMILGCVGFMFGTGGGALIAKTMGEGEGDKANKIFSLIVYTSIACGVVLAAIGFIFMQGIASLLGAEGQMLSDCVLYGRIIVVAVPAFILQYEFQCLFVTAGKPKLGLYITLAAGIVNIVLDALLVGLLDMGLVGAALATSLSQVVGGFIPLVYFFCRNGSLLRLGKTRWDGRALIKTCANGSSELMANISMSIVSMLYNIQLLRFAGEAGVSAYGVLMYVNMIFISIFLGYSSGSAPIISYNYGAQNKVELKALLKKSLVIIGISSVLMFGACLALARPMSWLYVRDNQYLYDMTVHAFMIYSFSFLFSGLAIFSSGFFTALNDGVTSAIMAFLRTLVFQTAAVLLLPLALGLDGIWLSIIVAEVAAVVLAIVFLIAKRKKHGYA